MNANGLRTLGLALAAGLAVSTAQADSPQAKADPQAGMQLIQKQMALMTPELQEKAKALSPEIKQFLARIVVKHPRHSDRLTMVQVMHELLADYQTVAMGIAMDNGEMAAEAARRLALHRLPRGGLLPYLPLEKVNSRDLAVLPAMEETVEGGAMRLAEAAEKGDMTAAATHLGEITAGCVSCHKFFRGVPGESARLRK